MSEGLGRPVEDGSSNERFGGELAGVSVEDGGDHARPAVGNELLSSRLATQNVEVLNEAGAITIVVTCPFCRVVLSDALTSQQAAGSAPESVEVVDVAQMLLAAVRRGTPA